MGHLRDYQREGLGWMHFLREFGFGGLLADDMGVGKTAQVLALLENRRFLRGNSGINGEEAPPGPSLVVAPRSLVFKWKEEAARFTPRNPPKAVRLLRGRYRLAILQDRLDKQEISYEYLDGKTRDRQRA